MEKLLLAIKEGNIKTVETILKQGGFDINQTIISNSILK